MLGAGGKAHRAQGKTPGVQVSGFIPAAGHRSGVGLDSAELVAGCADLILKFALNYIAFSFDPFSFPL